MEINQIAKRVRRCEVNDLESAEDIHDIKLSIRALYEAFVVLALRASQTNIGADPVDLLMLPPWHKDPATGNTVPPPSGLDLEKRSFAVFRLHLQRLTEDQEVEIRKRQERHRKRLAVLREREKEREAQVKREARSSEPEMER